MKQGKGISILFAVLAFLWISRAAQAAEECSVRPDLTLSVCVCHNIKDGGGPGEICPSESGIDQGHDCHLAELCCFQPTDPLPIYCNFQGQPGAVTPFLDCSMVNEGGVLDTFGKCNGCGNRIRESNTGCCDPDVEPATCTDSNNFCEECDDGNNLSGDGCDANCQLERCGDGNIDQGSDPQFPIEECDDGNTVAGDGCNSDCRLERCNQEVCDGLDNDCDDQADEGFNVGSVCDGSDADLCPDGTIVCDGNGGTTCNDDTTSKAEVCQNGRDDDCNGLVDDGCGPLAECIALPDNTAPVTLSSEPRNVGDGTLVIDLSITDDDLSLLNVTVSADLGTAVLAVDHSKITYTPPSPLPLEFNGSVFDGSVDVNLLIKDSGTCTEQTVTTVVTLSSGGDAAGCSLIR